MGRSRRPREGSARNGAKTSRQLVFVTLTNAAGECGSPLDDRLAGAAPTTLAPEEAAMTEDAG